jgi:hypothetical protein
MLQLEYFIELGKKKELCALDILNVGLGLEFNVAPCTVQSTLVYNVIFTPSHRHICSSQVYTTWILSKIKPNHAELGSPNPTPAALTYPLHMDPRGVADK